MKILIDTERKTIKVEEQINLADFLHEIKKLLPNWKEYEIEAYQSTYTYIPYTSPTIDPSWPQEPIITCGTYELSGTTTIIN